MIKQKNIPSLMVTIFLLGCGGASSPTSSTTINVNNYYYASDAIRSNAFNVNKGEEVTLLIDINTFPEEYNYANSLIFFIGNAGEGEYCGIFDEITLFKYNDVDVIRKTDIQDIYNNNYMIFKNDLAYGDSIGLCHDNPNKTDKITIAGIANNNYENIVVNFYYLKY